MLDQPFPEDRIDKTILEGLNSLEAAHIHYFTRTHVSLPHDAAIPFAALNGIYWEHNTCKQIWRSVFFTDRAFAQQRLETALEVVERDDTVTFIEPFVSFIPHSPEPYSKQLEILSDDGEYARYVENKDNIPLHADSILAHHNASLDNLTGRVCLTTPFPIGIVHGEQREDRFVGIANTYRLQEADKFSFFNG
ncbi:MAG: hypothetical protein OXR66_00125 [Candidatus Woesearchaeota archaeon]|nr:hypothetical protein [Candidatus Woesearchaeota archaeon]